MVADDINSRIEHLGDEIEKLSTQCADDATRKKLFDVVSNAATKLEPPFQTVWRMLLSPHAPAALMVMTQMGVVEDLVRAQRPKTARELCESCGGEELLIVRMMRPLVGLGFFRETDVHTYESTAVSQMLTTPALMSGFQFMHTITHPSVVNMPHYLAKTGYKNVNQHPGPFQDYIQSEEGVFPYLTKHPAAMNNFNVFMSGSLKTRQAWHDTYPVHDILLAGARQNDANAALLVDVAGGRGHDIAAFHQAFPHAPGKLILQDLPAVIESIQDLPPAIVRQKHDFFTPQPVRGARAYYFRSIFHDWHDEACVRILSQIASVMERGYSKLLIFEWVLPERGVPLHPALLDLNMMAVCNGMERTEAQWTELLGKGGFKVVRFHKKSEDAEGLIEAELA